MTLEDYIENVGDRLKESFYLIKVFSVIADFDGIHKSKIAEMLSLPRKEVHISVDALFTFGVVQFEEVGRMKFYRLTDIGAEIASRLTETLHNEQTLHKEENLEEVK
ncbi:hypothetical protein ACFSCX_06610 [Bacillus salitolerans]|uniref:Transcriptional regulator n=1 Tax=Bacillus salitolerans TaxID=1437434 RepID=A0ABW4LM23_9BACI